MKRIILYSFVAGGPACEYLQAMEKTNPSTSNRAISYNPHAREEFGEIIFDDNEPIASEPADSRPESIATQQLIARYLLIKH